MASYTRQSTFADGDLITAALFNNEYNQLVDAFDNATGHKHDGTIGEGPVLGVLGDAGLTIPLNKILIDTTNDHIEFFIDVSGTSTQQLYIADGAIVPTTDNDIDLGTNALQFKDLYLNGTANIDSLVADTIDINGGTIDGVTIGGTSAGAITGTTITGTSFVIGSATITETELEILDGATLSTTELNYVDGVTSSIQTQIDTKAPLASPSLTGIPTAPTAAANTNTTQVATTAYVQTEITELIAGAPGTLDTLNELAAAINDDANYNTTLTTALATKLPLAGGTMTGNVTYGDNVKANFGTSEDLQIYHDGSNSYITDVGTGNLIITGNLTGNVTGTVSDISNHSTSDLSEGTNLYYTDARVQAVSINNVVEDTTPQLGGNLASNGNDILFADNDKAIFGAGSDLQIFHNGSHSYVSDQGTGNLRILAENFQVKNAADNEAMIVAVPNAGVSLYYNNTAKLATTATGINVTGTVTSDGLTVDTATGSASPTPSKITIATSTNASDWSTTSPWGSLAFYSADSSAGGAKEEVTLDVVSAQVTGGVSDFRINTYNSGAKERFRISHDGDISFYEDTGTSAALFWDASAERLGLGTTSPTTTLDVNGTIKYGSLSDGTITITGFADEDNMASNSATLIPTQQSVKAYVDSQVSSAGGTGISFADNEKAQFGASNDLQIYHDAANGSSYISEAGAGNLYLQGSNLILEDINGGNFLYGTQGGDVKVYHNGSTKLATTSTGIDVVGTATMDGLVVEGNTYIDTNNGADAFYVTRFGNVQNESASFVVDDGALTINSIQDEQYGSFRINSTRDGVGTAARFNINNGGDISFYDDTGTSQALFWDASAESLGIGTTSPAARLDILGSKDSTNLIVSAALNTVGGGSLADYNEILFDNTQVSGASGQAYIRHFANSHNDSESAIAFGTTTTGGTTNEALRIRGNGNVGIGTTSPSYTLDVASAAANNQTLARFSSSGGVRAIFNTDSDDDGSLSLYDKNDAAQVLIRSLGSSYLNGGNVGIGTTSPEGTLHVENASNNALIMDAPANRYNAIGFQTAGVDKWWLGRADSDQIAGDAFFIGVDNGNVTDAGGLSSKLVIDSSGSVGIGTTSPATTLDVAGSGAEIAIRDTRNQSWTIGDTVASLGFYSDDASGSSGSTLNLARGAIDLVTTSTFGSTHDMVFKTRGDVTTSALERLRITSSGRVGIGTTSPSQALDVVGAIKVSDGILNAGAAGSASVFNEDGTTADFRVESSGNTHMLFVDGGLNRVGIGTSSPASTLEISKNDQTNGATLSITNSFEGGSWTAGDTVGTVDFRVDDGSTTEKIRGQIKVFDDTSVSTTYPAYNAMSFSTGNLNTLNERMRIDSSGRVGIGTTSPSAKLHIDTGSDEGIRMQRTGTNANFHAIEFRNSDDTATNSKIGWNSNELRLEATSTYRVVTNSSDALLINSLGNVGIGTTSPSGNLDVTSTVSTSIDIQGGDGNSKNIIFRKTTGGTQQAKITAVGDDLRFTTGTTSERMRIDSSGNVGIGTTSPAFGAISTGIEVEGTTAGIRLQGATTGALELYHNNGLSTIDSRVATGGSKLAFNTEGSERLRITSSGNVGIGTSSPSAGLQVAKGSSTIPAAGASTSSACFGNDASDDNYGVVVGANSNGVGYISSQRTDGTATTYNLSIQPNGGNVGIGTSPADKLHVEGNIYLGASNRTIYTGGSGNLTLQTNTGQTIFLRSNGSSESMRIDSSGNLLVGTTSVQGSGGVTLSGAGYVYSSRPSSVAIYADRTGSDGAIQEFRKDGTTVGSIATTSGAINLYGGSGTNGITIDSSGNVTATGNVTAYSDERLKDNIQTLQGSKVLEMRGVSYTKDGEASSGVIAQEIEKVAPELVHTAKDEMGTKSVAYGNLVGYLIEAIKDQQKEIEYMKSEIKTLKENK
jgi:hypothetical protein